MRRKEVPTPKPFTAPLVFKTSLSPTEFSLQLPLTPLCLVDFPVRLCWVAGYVGLEPLYKIDSLVC